MEKKEFIIKIIVHDLSVKERGYQVGEKPQFPYLKKLILIKCQKHTGHNAENSELETCPLA